MEWAPVLCGMNKAPCGVVTESFKCLNHFATIATAALKAEFA